MQRTSPICTWSSVTAHSSILRRKYYSNDLSIVYFWNYIFRLSKNNTVLFKCKVTCIIGFKLRDYIKLVLVKVVGIEVNLKHSLEGVWWRTLLDGLVVLVLDLGSEVIPDVAKVGDVVLHHQGDVRWHGERHLGREARGLGEHVQVPATNTCALLFF